MHHPSGVVWGVAWGAWPGTVAWGAWPGERGLGRVARERGLGNVAQERGPGAWPGERGPGAWPGGMAWGAWPGARGPGRMGGGWCQGAWSQPGTLTELRKPAPGERRPRAIRVPRAASRVCRRITTGPQTRMPACHVTAFPTAPTAGPATWTQASASASPASSAASATAATTPLPRSPRSAAKVRVPSGHPSGRILGTGACACVCASACVAHTPGVWGRSAASWSDCPRGPARRRH